MQARFGAAFLTVALLYALIGVGVPRLGLHPASAITLTVSSYCVIGLGAAWAISRHLGRRLRRLAEAATTMSHGDLTPQVALDTRGDDEIAELGLAFSTMRRSLAQIVVEVRATADRIRESAVALSATSASVDGATEGIAATVREIAQGAEAQAGQVAGTAATTLELARGGHEVAACAGDVHLRAADATERATRGSDEARRAAAGLGAVSEATRAAAGAIEGFRNRALQIGSLVASIGSISHQTHLLAINAAIEAARAGEEGRGFAVVADEVGRLAESVRRFAGEISAISAEIREESERVAGQFRDSVHAAERVRDVVERNAGSFEGIVDAIRDTAERAGTISSLAAAQREAAESVRRSLDKISGIAERNHRGTEDASRATERQTASMRGLACSARELAESSERLRERVASFRLA